MPRGIYSITSWTPNLEDEPRRIFKKPPQHGFRRRIWRKGKYPFGGHWRSPSPFLWYIPHFFNTSTPIQPQFLLCINLFFLPFLHSNLWGLRQFSPPGRSSPEVYFGGFIAPRNKIRYKYRKTNSKFLSCTDPFFDFTLPPLMFFVLIIDAKSRCQNFCVCWVAY